MESVNCRKKEGESAYGRWEEEKKELERRIEEMKQQLVRQETAIRETVAGLLEEWQEIVRQHELVNGH